VDACVDESVNWCERGGNQVMTTVYGVTFIGAREQIERQLKDRHEVPAEHHFYAAAYLAKKVHIFLCALSIKLTYDMRRRCYNALGISSRAPRTS